MTQPTPAIGRIVQYKLSEQDAEAINRRRSDAATRRRLDGDADRVRRVQAGPSAERYVGPGWVEHTGNEVHAGDIFPLVITRVWPADTHGVNGQVLLDGNDTLWVTSVAEGDSERQYTWPVASDQHPASLPAKRETS